MAGTSASERIWRPLSGFKSGTPRGSDGKHPGSSEKCRVFPTIEEARSDSQGIVKSHPVVVCVICDHQGKQVARVRNEKEITRFATASLVGILVWRSVLALAGMALLWILYRLALSILRLWRPGIQPIRSLPWFGWIVFAAAGVCTLIYAWYLRMRIVTSRRVRRMFASFTPEERKRFRANDNLHSTNDPAERERLLKLYREYQERIQQALEER